MKRGEYLTKHVSGSQMLVFSPKTGIRETEYARDLRRMKRHAALWKWTGYGIAAVVLFLILYGFMTAL